MAFAPRTREELAAALQAATQRRAPIGPVALHHLNRICRHAPEDLTITAEAGLTLGDLQAALARHGQWLPIDPSGADGLTLAELLDRDLSGPRRLGYGTLREHLIGLRVVLADGRLIRSGGEVVKNVAGYDLLKLFVGAHGSLGVIVEVSFKLLPRPEAEAFASCDCASWEEVEHRLEAVLASPITPVVLDLHRPPVAPEDPHPPAARLTVGFAGSRDAVSWQLQAAAGLGFQRPDSLDYDRQFHERSHASPTQPTHRVSVLPSRLVATLRQLHATEFVARAGNGLIFYRGGLPPAPTQPPNPGLTRRLKLEFDPLQLLPAPPHA